MSRSPEIRQKHPTPECFWKAIGKSVARLSLARAFPCLERPDHVEGALPISRENDRGESPGSAVARSQDEARRLFAEHVTTHGYKSTHEPSRECVGLCAPRLAGSAASRSRRRRPLRLRP